MDLILRFRPTPEELEAEFNDLYQSVPKARRWAVVAIDVVAAVVFVLLGLFWIAAILGALTVYHVLMLSRGPAGRIARAVARFAVDTTVRLSYDGYQVGNSGQIGWRHTKVTGTAASWVFLNPGRPALIIPKRALNADEQDKLTVLLSGVEAERTERRF